jgi:molecular chaperone GrpE
LQKFFNKGFIFLLFKPFLFYQGIDDAKSFGIQGFCKDLLEVADILNLAVVNTNPAKDVNASMTAKEVEEKLNSMYGGLVMTEKCLLKIFERNHLMQIEPAEGDKFDPNFHDAIFRVPIPGKQSGTVNVCTKKGFKLKERVIRAAQVGVVQ